MKIQKFEQSGFIFESNSGFRLALDVGRYTPLDKTKELSADAFLISHIHGDHFDIEKIISLSPRTLYLPDECMSELGEDSFNFSLEKIQAWQEIKIGDFMVTVFPVDHGPNVSSPIRDNFGFLIECDGEDVYFAGDMFYESGMDVTSIEADVALVPVGTFYTFGPQEAFDFIKRFKKIGKIIPMHYEKTPETKEEFIKLATNFGFSIQNQEL